MRLAEVIGEMAAQDFPELWAALTEAGREAFTREVEAAYVSAAGIEDRPPAIASVIEAWLRTLRLRETPGYDDAVERAREHVNQAPGEFGEKVYTLEEIRDHLQLPPK